MRKIVVLSMITMDGVLQAPGGPEEDLSHGFKFGGWTAPYGSEDSGEIFKKLMQPSDLLLGRMTFEIWENYWPLHAAEWPGINQVTKYVFSNTRKQSDWSNCRFIENLEDIEALKNSKGSDIKVWGSSELIQLLLQNDLVDAFWLMIYPITLGEGKRLFNGGAIPAAFTLVENFTTSKGVIISHYKRAGDVETGNVG